MHTQPQPQELSFENVWRMFQETDRKFQETDRKFQESRIEFDRRLQALSKQVGRLSDDIGYFAESMVKPAVIGLFAERGIVLKDVASRRTSRQPGAAMEVDILAVDDQYVGVVEVKTHLKSQDIDEHLARLDKFKAAFPAYQNLYVVGAVAAMQVAAEVATYAYRQGLFVLAQSGETMCLLNDADFQPYKW